MKTGVSTPVSPSSIIRTWMGVTTFGEEEIDFTESPLNFPPQKEREESKREKKIKNSRYVTVHPVSFRWCIYSL